MNLNNESLFEAFQHSRGGGDARFAGRPVDSCRTAWDPFGKDAPASQPDDLHDEMEEEARRYCGNLMWQRGVTLQDEAKVISWKVAAEISG